MTTTNKAKKHILNLLSGAGLNIINLLIGVIIGLVLTPFLVKSLGARYYGINEIIATFVGCFMLLDLGIDSAVARFFTLHYSREEKKECLEIANTAFFLFLLFGLLGTLGIILSAVGIYFIYPKMEDRTLFLHIMLINGIAFGLNFITKVFFGVVNGTMKQYLTSSRDVFIRLLGMTLTFLVVYFGGRLYAISFVNLGITIFNVFLMLRLAKFAFPEFMISRLLFKMNLVRKLFGFAFATFIVFVGDTITTRGGVFVIGVMLSVEAATPLMAVSMKLCELYALLMLTICGGWLISWLTYLYANNEKKLIDESMSLAYKVCTYAASFMFFGIVVWSPDFVSRWMGGNFLIAYDSLIIIAAEHWIIFSHAPNTKFLFAIAKHRFLADCHLVSAIVQIFLMIIFVNWGWGITGVAMGYFLASIPVRGLIIPIYVLKIRQVDFFRYYANIILYMMISAIGFILPYLISRQLLTPDYKTLLIIGILSVCCYVPFIFIVGFDKTEKEKIKNILLSVIRKNK
ncbi:MAG: hypothetical protein LBB88_01270 [Planctomycetaceae bacterium]|jgi:O-antigen/teichoic acid export membrane protein|nr:hypothetical protein [Planctomycetaceae bacterium]